MTEKEFSASISRMVEGDMEGLKAIYEAYHVMIYHCMYDVVQSREIAEDLAADFFVKLWSVASKFKGTTHRAWLLTIARNMALDHVRKHQKEQLESDEVISQVSVESEDSTLVNQLALKEAMDRLPQDEREIINLKVLAQLTFKEISRLIPMPMGTVTWKYREGIRKLRRWFDEAGR